MPRMPLACLLVLLLGMSAFADEKPATEKAQKGAKSTPFAKAAASWPAPSEKHAFRVELVATIQDTVIGTYLVEVGPAVVEGEVVGWRIRERLEVDFAGKQGVGESVYSVTPDLRPIEGRSSENLGDDPSADRWRVVEGKVELTHERDDETRTQTVEAAAWLCPGHAGLYMAARFLPAASTTIEGRDFSGENADSPVAPFVLVVDADARHESLQVLALEGRREERVVRVVVDPKTRAVLASSIVLGDGSMRVTLLPRDRAPKKDDLFARAPRTAAEASVQTIFAMKTQDRARIEKAFRWTTMYELTKQQLERAQEPVPGFEEYKQGILDEVQAGQPELDITEDQLKAGLQLLVPDLQVRDLPEGRKAVYWPQGAIRLVLVMEKKDDGWKAIGMRHLGE